MLLQLKKVRREERSTTSSFERTMYKFTGIAPELNYLDCAKTLSALTAPTDCSGGEMNPTTGCTGCLSAPSQGDAYNQRDGSKITIKSILIQGHCIYLIKMIKQHVTLYL